MKARIARQALLLIALAFLPAIGQAIYFRDRTPWQSSTPASEMVTVAQARSWGTKVMWVDARPADEYAKDHIPGAVSLNEEHWTELFPGFIARWSSLAVSEDQRRVVVYCSSKDCNLARDLARRLRTDIDPPMRNVYVLEGGWEAWLRSK